MQVQEVNAQFNFLTAPAWMWPMTFELSYYLFYQIILFCRLKSKLANYIYYENFIN